MSVNRRSVLYGIGSAAAGALGFGAYSGEIALGENNVPDVISELSEDKSTLHKEFGPFSGGFEEITWSLKGDLFIKISDDHDMDGWGIRHDRVDADEYDEYVIMQEAPLGGGEIQLDFDGLLSRKYPSRTFQLVSMDGEFSNFLSLVEEINTSVQFNVPKNAIGDDHFS